jgi:hypothetical protein
VKAIVLILVLLLSCSPVLYRRGVEPLALRVPVEVKGSQQARVPRVCGKFQVVKIEYYITILDTEFRVIPVPAAVYDRIKTGDSYFIK